MQCPNDGQALAMTTREGIEIDYCPTCRGVWLDRGELDKIIERTAAVAAVPSGASGPSGFDARERRQRDDDDDERERGRYGQGGRDERGGYGEHGGYGKRKRKSFLDDLFDFG